MFVVFFYWKEQYLNINCLNDLFENIKTKIKRKSKELKCLYKRKSTEQTKKDKDKIYILF